MRNQMIPTPEHEIKYLIAQENKPKFSDLSDGDIDRLLKYFQKHRPMDFKHAVCSASYGVFFGRLCNVMDYQTATRRALVSVTCIDTMFNEISKRIEREK